MSIQVVLSNPVSKNRFAKIAALAVLSSAVALTTGCATKRATSEVVVAPLGIPSGQVGYTGAVLWIIQMPLLLPLIIYKLWYILVLIAARLPHNQQVY